MKLVICDKCSKYYGEAATPIEAAVGDGLCDTCGKKYKKCELYLYEVKP